MRGLYVADMNSVSSFFAAAFVSVAPIASRAAVPDLPELSRGSVTIPYTELRALWESAHARKTEAEPPDAAPVAHVVHRADYHLRLGEVASVLEAAFEVEALGTKWQTIPLLGGEARLDKVDAGERAIIWHDGYCLLTNQPARTSVTLELTARGSKDLTAGSALQLRLGNATIKRLQISGIPAGVEARVNGRPPAELKDGAAFFAVPSEGGEISVKLVPPQVQKREQPSRWETQSQTLVRYGEGWLHYETHLFAHADGGSGLDMMLVLPPTAGSVSVKGDDLADWTSERLDERRRLMRIRWKTPDVLDRELLLSYAVAQSPLSEQWNLQAPAVLDHPESRHLIAILPGDGLELKGDALRAAITLQRLPQWMREAIGGAPFATAEGNAQLTVDARWLPTVATASAVIGAARAQLRLVADGSLQTSVNYLIRHEAPMAWQLELPKEVDILSCTVAGKAARPIQRDAGVIELRLPALGDAGNAGTEVALVFTGKGPPLDPVSGQVELALPRTALFLERLDWAVAIPDAFDITAVSGNVAIAAGAKLDRERGEQIIALRKDLGRGERPSVALFYQRRGLVR